MIRAAFAVLLATVVLAGCGGENALRQASRVSPLERVWLGNWHANVVSAPVAHDAAAEHLRLRIADRALQLHLRVLRHGRLVFELWSNGTGGGSRSEPGISGCNGALDVGLGIPPPCPPEGILGFEFG